MTVTGVVPEHLKSLLAKVREMGADVVVDGDEVTVAISSRPKAVDIKTLPYPGFPTDLQAPMMAALVTAEGTATVTETLFENRFAHVPELRRMGARIQIQGQTAIITGVERLQGAPVTATDLRSGAALVLAGWGPKGSPRSAASTTSTGATWPSSRSCGPWAPTWRVCPRRTTRWRRPCSCTRPCTRPPSAGRAAPDPPSRSRVAPGTPNPFGRARAPEPWPGARTAFMKVLHPYLPGPRAQGPRPRGAGAGMSPLPVA